MRSNLIKLEKSRPPSAQSSSVLVLDPTILIQHYPQLPESTIHSINDLTRLPGTEPDSYVFMYRDILLKFAAEPKVDMDSFRREIMIGLEINKLTNPGFVKTVGYYKDINCKIPILGEAFQRRSCTYLYLEKIPGPTMKKFIKTASLLQFKIVMSKLTRNYKVALDALNYSHYDLHPANIVISTTGEELMPVIIDLEASHISFRDGDLGEDFEEVGRYPNESNWIYDFFKLLAMCWIETSEAFMVDNAVNNHRNTIEEVKGVIAGVNRIRYGWRFDRALDDEVPIEETLPEYLDRAAATERSELGQEIIANGRASIAAAFENISSTRYLFSENGDNLRAINNHCLQLLKYFHSHVSADWLLRYQQKFDRHFSSWRTEEGYASRFDDFISYCDSVSGF